MRSISEIIVHCSATRADWWASKSAEAKRDEIRRWHVEDRKWKDIGYHQVIDRNGKVVAGRPIEKTGAHVKGHNTGTIGVCLLGGHGSAKNDRFEDHFTPEQDKALRDYIASQKAKFPSIRKISGHNEYSSKACPGFLVGDWFKSGLPDSLASLAESSTPSPTPVADARFDKFFDFVLQSALQTESRAAGQDVESRMGITLEKLAEWRKVSPSELTMDDLFAVTSEEIKQLYRTRYYAACRCAEMPERMSLAIYDAAAQFGPSEAVKLAQKAFNRMGMTVDGEPLVEDGLIGRLTMAAIKQTDQSFLADAFLDEVEAHLRSQSMTPDTIAEGLARLAALREFVNTLPKGSGIRPSVKMKVSDRNIDFGDIMEIAGAARSGNKKAALTKIATMVLDEDADDSASTSRKKALGRLLLGMKDADGIDIEDVATITKGPDGKPPLTPVNAALGETIGRALNGKKSVTGIAGLLLTTLLPDLGLEGDIVSIITENASSWLTIFSLITGWGFLGKIDKAIRLVGMVNVAK
ncbi:N-acetylmuramoyl-L-alanine amidase [uncultured Roseobacter sp.]|uniref:N-acetylmuramoyl-L-alanine amidase n=1 Tax=uncultured Roseobacter sp. TaxID=114847 RepID=UPI00263718DB|nr:N-acetylmuramoyl-L-alanine amidase [uncultured Roseobacter sp.]